MKAVTIDNFDIKVHEQYAKGQVLFDPTFIVDAQGLSPHFETGGTSSIYSSQWEELFEIGIRNVPWALFSAPISFKMHRKRYFHLRIIPSMEESLEDEENDQGVEEKAKLLQKILKTKKSKRQSHETFEKERSALLNFFDSVKILDNLLSQINARKLWGQKG